MEFIVNDTVVNSELNNKLFEQGYLYSVEGDWTLADTIDPWSGMPDVNGRTHFFTDRAEAELYAMAQTWVFNPCIHGEVKEMAYRETPAELHARLEAERVAQEAQKEVLEKEKAEKLGLTVEEYREKVKLVKKIKRYKKEIRELEEKVAELTTEIKRKKKFLENVKEKA